MSQNTPDEEEVDDPVQGDEIVAPKKKFEKPPYKQRIFVVHGTTETLAEEDLLLTTLPHPKRGCQARYALTKSGILEVQRLVEEPASWFVRDSVQADGSVYLATPVDPMFLVIKLLENSRKQSESHAGFFCPLDQIFTDTSQPGYAHLFHLVKEQTEQLALLCDVNDKMDEPLFRLNDSKVVRWLRCKVDHFSDHLAHLESTSTVLGGAQSTTFRESTKKARLSAEDLRRASIGFFSEYVDPIRIEALAASYGMKDFGPTKLNAFDDLNGFKSEKGKRTNEDPFTPKETEPKKPKVELSASQKRLAKTNIKGMSKMSAFFAPAKK